MQPAVPLIALEDVKPTETNVIVSWLIRKSSCVNKEGTIINISSIGGLMGPSRIYSAGKFAMEGIVKSYGCKYDTKQSHCYKPW
jgi:NAD(P)-dependent dehydrogenase (short-subunit alcohol dehydrogenase family)